MTKVPRLVVLLAGLWFLQMEPAQAAFHLVMVTEVFPGYASSPYAQYVELQMYAPGQNFAQTRREPSPATARLRPLRARSPSDPASSAYPASAPSGA